ncbi:hypothetical protein [Curtobacterium sp. MCBD17_008]|uniref:DUF7352 domain-containing protein n=1 Tax=Curtobacterium sp. MCBD17_008 TaxID=2175656 RepID=UPI0015E89CA7|nr:hypothetical protein [Curtobacterium sp. MCBD17_008]
MQTIHRHMITPSGSTIQIPADAEPIAVEADERIPGLLNLWVRLNPDHPTVDRTFTIVGTGHDVHESWTFIGSAVRFPGTWIKLHLFETTKGA